MDYISSDRELLVRIDERLEYVVASTECQGKDIESLKKWKNSMAGGLSIVVGLTGYTFIF